jgi:hypothetical protein
MKRSNEGLLTTKEKVKLFAKYPCLDSSFEEDYASEVSTLLEGQRGKTLHEVVKYLNDSEELNMTRAVTKLLYNIRRGNIYPKEVK